MSLTALLWAASAWGQEALRNGAWTQGAISRAGEIDLWTLDAPAGAHLLLRVGTVGFAPRIRLVAADGVQLAESPAVSSSNRDNELVYRLERAGPLTVQVLAQSASATGSYDIELVTVPGVPAIAAGDEGGDLANGPRQAGELRVGDLDPWRFPASAGDQLLLRVGTTNFTPRLNLYGPGGALVAQGLTINTGNRDAQIVTEAPESGIYTAVLASHFAGGRGAYQLTALRVPGTAVAGPGDEGGPVSSGDRVTGVLELGDLDRWTVSVAPGDYLHLRVGSQGFTPYVRLFDALGRMAGEGYTANTGNRDAEISLRVTEGGTYSAVVGSYYLNSSGSYTLDYLRVPGETRVPPGGDGGPLASGVRLAARLDLGDLDAWSFSGRAGEQVAVRVGSTGFTPRLRLHGPDGALVEEEVTPNTGNRDAELTLRLPQSGTYTVVVSSYYLGTEGEYRISFVQAADTVVVPEGDEGGPVTSALRLTGALAGGDLDAWTIEATAGQQILARVGTSTFTPRLRLFGPSGTLVADEFTANTGNRDARVVERATRDGRYLLLVSSYYYGREGAYELHASTVPGTYAIAPGDEGGALRNGSRYAATNLLGDLDFWTFQATPGDSNSVVVSSVGFTPWIRIYGPQGDLVSETFTANTGVRQARASYVVTNEGPHTIVMSSFYLGASGGYEFQYLRFPPDLEVPAPVRLREGETLRAPLSAQDPAQPEKPLTFTLLSGPPGAAVRSEGPTNAVVEWTPTEADGPGTHPFVVTVTDVVSGRPFVRTNRFEVTVDESNRPPVLADATWAGDEEVTLVFQVPAVDEDLPPNSLSFELVQGPAGMVIDPFTGELRWTPGELDGPATVPVTVRVTDQNPAAVDHASLAATHTFNLSVREVNRPPSVEIDFPATGAEGAGLSGRVRVTDPDQPANPISLRLLRAPAGATVSPDGVVEWTPPEEAGPGTHAWDVVVTDSSADLLHPSWSVTNRIVVAVAEVNTAPVLDVAPETSVPAGTTWRSTLQAQDADLPVQPLAYTLVSGPEGMRLEPASGELTWLPEVSQIGTHEVTVEVADGWNPPLMSRVSFEVRVVPFTVALSIERAGDGSLRLLARGAVGSRYRLETSTDLLRWEPGQELILGETGAEYREEPGGAVPARYFRLRGIP